MKYVIYHNKENKYYSCYNSGFIFVELIENAKKMTKQACECVIDVMIADGLDSSLLEVKEL